MANCQLSPSVPSTHSDALAMCYPWYRGFLTLGMNKCKDTCCLAAAVSVWHTMARTDNEWCEQTVRDLVLHSAPFNVAGHMERCDVMC